MGWRWGPGGGVCKGGPTPTFWQRWEKQERKGLWGQMTLLLEGFVPPVFKAAFPLLVKDSLGDPENPTPL